jgi:glycosyltransferase involved in cell wall biosynthesis
VCRDRERIVPSKLTVVYDGLDLSTFVLNDSRNEIRRTLGLTDSSRIVFITPANFRPQKAHHVLVAAIGQCQSRLGNCEFWFVGAGELRRVIEERVRQAGLAGSVRFMGVRTDIPRLLHAADVLVLPSVFESLPRTIMEAMAASKPVIATRVGGVCEVVIDGRTGLIVPPGEPGPLAEALVLMATDPEYRSRMGLAGRLRAEERYDVRKCLVRTEQLYRRLVLRKARRLETVCSRSEGREPGDGVSNQCRR